jgi:glutamate 5-kinase
MRIVVKVGTHAIANKAGKPDHAALKRLVEQLSGLRKAGHEVFFVSSGAVAAGVEALGLKARPSDVNDVQMCAAVGQARFIYEYERLFAEHGVKIGQILLTHYDFEDHHRAQNVKKSLDHLVRCGIVPVINENDVVADEELKGKTFGDNDWMSYLIARLVKADTLVLLSNIDGIYTGNPNDPQSQLIKEVAPNTDLTEYIQTEKSSAGRGGMQSKYATATKIQQAGIRVVIANGKRENVLVDLMEHPETTPHTLFKCS